MKKLAVLVGGEFREFENAHKTWGFLKDFDYDIFISTWDMSYEINEKLNINLSEKVTSDRIRKYFPNAIINIQDDFNVNIESSYKMLHHWKMLYYMLMKSGNEYDTILLIRPDICLSYEDNFSEMINNILDDRIYNLSWVQQIPPPGYAYVNDVFFIGKTPMMLKVIAEFPNPFNLNKSIHYHLAKYFFKNNIYVDGSLQLSIRFFIMRSIHRYFLDENFDKQIDLSNEWWSIKHYNGELTDYFKNKNRI